MAVMTVNGVTVRVQLAAFAESFATLTKYRAVLRFHSSDGDPVDVVAFLEDYVDSEGWEFYAKEPRSNGRGGEPVDWGTVPLPAGLDMDGFLEHLHALLEWCVEQYEARVAAARTAASQDVAAAARYRRVTT